MKIFNYFAICVLATLAAVLVVPTQGQTEPEDPLLHILSSFLKKSEYVHKVMFQLLGYKMVSYPGGIPVPEPMHFDNFTFEHVFGNWLLEGESHTYDPVLHGFAQSTFTIHPVVGEDYGVRIHLFIPVANLTGTYDLDVRQLPFFSPEIVWTGGGTYEHVFHDVHLWIDLTVGTTVDGLRVIPTDIHSSLEFSRCNLWAENYRTDGVPWTESQWISQSASYKVRYDNKALETDILLSETVASYFSMFWGILQMDKDSAYQGLIQSGEQPVTRKPLSIAKK